MTDDRPTPALLRQRAARIADEVLFPAALEVDAADRVPAGHLDLLAAEGFMAVAAPPELGGLEQTDRETASDLVLTLASGCLATTFMWIQHNGAVRGVAASDRTDLRDGWLAPLARGEVRGGIALAGARGGPAQTRVRRTDTGYVLDGESPWVTGWDMVDVLLVAAVDDTATVHFLLVDAVAGPTLEAAPLDLVSVRASRTVTLRFTDHEVPADRLVRTQPLDDWGRSQASGGATNGFLALGVVERCRRLIGSPTWVDAELAACRSALLTADDVDVPAARAWASDLAWRASGALAVHSGARSVLRPGHPERLVREAAFLLVFGSRSMIKEALLARLGR
ncbi:MAG: acyl-CoA/acyl-ACP dehydrogenase [Chloroflexi bacterium]|nr:acyl-CoA/acyl-ACP dehydrogenase [Chloroflexota bacterium]